MENTEVKRIQQDFGWNPNLMSLPVVNGFENKSWLVPGSSYSEEKTDYLDVPEGSSWWYETRNRIILKAIRKFGNPDCLWDIGSGPGVVGSYLSKNGVRCIGVEPSKSGVFVAAKRGLPSVLSDLVSLRLPDDCIGQIGLFDVYEHIEYRDQFLAEIFRVLKPGGSIFITVPALNYLWSAADEHAGHYVRYSRKKLKQELNANGFKIKESRYFFAMLVLPLLLLRAIPYRLGMKQPVDGESLLKQNGGKLGKLAQVIEVQLSRWTPIGTSLFAVAVKDDAR